MSEKGPTPDLPENTLETSGGLKLMVDGEEIIISPETMEELHAPEAVAAAEELIEYGVTYEQELKRDGLIHP